MQKIRYFINRVAYWTLPQGVDYILRRELIQKNKHEVDKVLPFKKNNNLLKNRHKGERCFILATGPSIQEQDLSGLADELCIAVSHFFLHKNIKIISPQYHVLAPYHHPFTFTDLKKVFEGFEENYSKEVNYFFGYRPYEFSIFDFLNMYPQKFIKNMYFVDYTRSVQLSEDNFNNPNIWDISKNPFQVRTVIYSAIQLAVFMGCSEIYLLGCDHDYLLDMKRVTNHHFYAEKDGVSDVEHLLSFTTEKWFKEYYFRWMQYRLMMKYMDSVGCKIFNATKGGMLDVFPRVDLCDVIK